MHLTTFVFIASALVALGAAQQLPRTTPVPILKRINRQINAAYSYGYEQQYHGVHAAPVAALVYQQPQAQVRQYYQPQPVAYAHQNFQGHPANLNTGFYPISYSG